VTRAYTVPVAAIALSIGAKWLDNVLSHHQVPGVERSRQGVARRLTPLGLKTLAVTILLMSKLHVPTARALDLARSLIGNGGRFLVVEGLVLEIDLKALEDTLHERLEYALEAAPVLKRGRPATSKTGRLD
jgi:hypothetical protein